MFSNTCYSISLIVVRRLSKGVSLTLGFGLTLFLVYILVYMHPLKPPNFVVLWTIKNKKS